MSDENVSPANTLADLDAASSGHVKTQAENVPTKKAWKVPPGYLSSGGALASLGAATYTGHVPIAVTATVAGVITILMLLTTLVSNVMPQKSEHRKDSILAALDHRRKMTVLKTKARAAKINTSADTKRVVQFDVRVIPFVRAVSDQSPPQDQRRRRDPA